MYNQGISREGDIIDLATELGVVEKRGSFYGYGDIRLAQGRENAKEFLMQNPDLTNEIELAVRQRALEAPVSGSGDRAGWGADTEEEVLPE
jgi:recombination protein RecA